MMSLRYCVPQGYEFDGGSAVMQREDCRTATMHIPWTALLMPATAALKSPTARLPAMTADFSDIHNALGPEERLLAVLHGTDERGPTNWVITTRRLLVLGPATHDQHIAHVSHAAITCVEQRTDPVGTLLRVRATGRQLTMSTIDAAQATHFCSLLRDRAGIGVPLLTAARVRSFAEPTANARVQQVTQLR